jgi:thymidylate synthase (FAD)
LKVELIRSTIQPVETMATAAATCYDSVPKDKIVEFCIISGHESISEFADFHFLVSGISRACSHQMVRHRLASFAQRSQRYVDEGEFDSIVPPSIERTPEAKTHYIDIINRIRNAYNSLKNIEGVEKDDARFLLPNACSTTINIKMNFRELMHFCNERCCSKASWEIREVANEMKRLVTEQSDFLGKFLGPKCLRLGYCPELKGQCGLRPTKQKVFQYYINWSTVMRATHDADPDELIASYFFYKSNKVE